LDTSLAIAVRDFWLNARMCPKERGRELRDQNEQGEFRKYLMNLEGSEVSL